MAEAAAIQPGALSLSPQSGECVLLSLSGRWCLDQDLPSPAGVFEAREAQGARTLTFEAGGVTDWDSGLLTFLRVLTREAAQRQVEADRSGLPEGVRRLLDLADAVPV